MAAHWHAHVELPGKPVDRGPAMTWERARAFKDRCERNWSRLGEVKASRRGTLIVSSPAGQATVSLVPCVNPRCGVEAPPPVVVLERPAPPCAEARPYGSQSAAARAFLLEWATANRGQVVVARILPEAVLRGHSANLVRHVLWTWDRFEHVARGVYRLSEATG